ncbi:MAG TPA: DUF2071 domain-containing protein [Gemmatimonadales bacterium]
MSGPTRARPLVTGRWSDLLFLTYEAPEAIVRQHLPPGVEPDRWNGRTHVNLVALQFGEIRVRGRRLPGLRGFAQLNLRTFARCDDVRGVVFLRQFVPNPIVVAVSRLRYRQPYATLPITHLRAERDGTVTTEYLIDQPPRGCIIATGSERTTVAPEDSFEHYCTERFWGFGKGGRGRLLRFRVAHPPWALRAVGEWRLLLDFGAFFGADWRFLNDEAPVSVLFAVGSEVAVYEPSSSLPTDSTSTTP